jgi:hypothetical protein
MFHVRIRDANRNAQTQRKAATTMPSHETQIGAVHDPITTVQLLMTRNT